MGVWLSLVNSEGLITLCMPYTCTRGFKSLHPRYQFNIEQCSCIFFKYKIIFLKMKKTGKTKKSNNYENWTFEELLAECKRRGLLDNNGRYKAPIKDSPYNFAKFVERTGLSFAEADAVIEFAIQENNKGLNKRILDLARK